jgi:hypothetical protein
MLAKGYPGQTVFFCFEKAFFVNRTGQIVTGSKRSRSSLNYFVPVKQ